MIIQQLPSSYNITSWKAKATLIRTIDTLCVCVRTVQKIMKKWFLLSLLMLTFCYPGETKGSLGIWDGIDWITDISIDYLQGFAWKCGQHAVRSAIYDGCEDLELASCRRGAEKVRDSHSNDDNIQYVCENLGSWIYQAAKAAAVVVVQAASHGLSFLGWLISIPLYYIGCAFGSTARYLLN